MTLTTSKHLWTNFKPTINKDQVFRFWHKYKQVDGFFRFFFRKWVIYLFLKLMTVQRECIYWRMTWVSKFTDYQHSSCFWFFFIVDIFFHKKNIHSHVNWLFVSWQIACNFVAKGLVNSNINFPRISTIFLVMAEIISKIPLI